MTSFHRSFRRSLLGLSFLTTLSACSLFDSGDEVDPTPLQATLLIAESGLHDQTLNMLCQGSIPLQLQIHGGRGPYEAVFTLTRASGRPVSTPFGLLSDEPIVGLKQEFGNEGGFTVPQPALQFAPFSGAAAAAGVTFGVLVKDRDSMVSFQDAVPGQPLPAGLAVASASPALAAEQAFVALVSTCSQP